MADPDISNILPINNQMVQQIRQEARASLAKAVESEGSLQNLQEASLFNPMLQAQRFREMEKLRHSQQKENVENPQDEKILGVESAEETASRFQRNNPEMNNRTLMILKSLISPDDTPEGILAKVFSVYPDPALADEALDFLIQTATPDTLSLLEDAKKILNRDFDRQIRAGRNMGAQAREFSKEGLGSPTSLRDLYRDVTGNRRDPLKLLDELAGKFSYDKLRTVVSFLLHSLGSDLKSKGPSIDTRELGRLMEETRSMQGILGLFRFFLSRSKLIERQFSAYNLKRPNQVNFETLARLFIKMLAERYMNPEKILQTAKPLGISEEIAAQIIVYTQMHDAIRQIAPRYYRNPQHKNEFTKAFVDTLEDLEEKLEEEDEKKGKKKKKKKEDKA